MGDLSAEPSMEDILSSIKRIIAEEDTPAGRRRPPVRPASAPAQPAEAVEEVLELSDPMPAASEAETADAVEPPAAPAADPAAAALSPAPPSHPDPIISPAAADATRGALQSLSKLLIKPEPQSDGTLEGLVRDMLRPMLREWLDANLPDVVEAMVAKEIARISDQRP